MRDRISLKDTRLDVVRLVFPQHANMLGTLYGGTLMNWMAEAGTLAASRIARGPVVLGSTDDIDFLNPIRIGEIVTLTAQVEYIGTKSMEVGVTVQSEDRKTGERKITTVAHFAYIAVDEEGKPREVGARLLPSDLGEEHLMSEASKRREKRLERLKLRKEKIKEVRVDQDVQYKLVYSKLVFPEDAYFGKLLFAGKLFEELDQSASILASRFVRGVVVTASIDAMDFYAPIRVGEILNIFLSINYVGRTSLEIGAKVIAENPYSGELRHTSTLYMTFVHLGRDGKPTPIGKKYEPVSPVEQERLAQALKRKEERIKRKKLLKRLLSP